MNFFLENAYEKFLQSVGSKIKSKHNSEQQRQSHLPPLVLGAIGIEHTLTEAHGQLLSRLLEVGPEQVCATEAKREEK